MRKFEAGDKVQYAKPGLAGWEWGDKWDWADYAGCNLLCIYTVTEVQRNMIKLSGILRESYWIPAGHFIKIS